MHRRAAIVRMSYETIRTLLGASRFVIESKGLPERCRFVAAQVNFEHGAIDFQIEADSLDPVPDGFPLPVLTFEMRLTPEAGEMARLRSENDAAHGAIADMLEEGKEGAKAFQRGREAERAAMSQWLTTAADLALARREALQDASGQLMSETINLETGTATAFANALEFIRVRGDAKPLPPHRLVAENERLRLENERLREAMDRLLCIFPIEGKAMSDEKLNVLAAARKALD